MVQNRSVTEDILWDYTAAVPPAPSDLARRAGRGSQQDLHEQSYPYPSPIPLHLLPLFPAAALPVAVTAGELTQGKPSLVTFLPCHLHLI